MSENPPVYPPLPPDDLKRNLTVAQIDQDKTLPHIGLVGDTYIMMLPKLEKSHGYELQFFTNYIGHFMLVTGLLAQLKDEGRVVMLSSEGHRSAPVGAIEFDNLSGNKGYQPLAAYGQSKIANLLFAKELQRALRRHQEDRLRGAPRRGRYQPRP